MATIKSYTDLEQSKKLAEILPLETADMYLWSSGKRYYIEAMDDGDFNEEEGHVRAWSLAALLGVLPRETRLLKSATDDTYHCDCPKSNVNKWFDNPIDAVFEMICLLKENGKI